MSIAPLEFLNIAAALQSKDEASNRTAASRAYYCAYHVCVEKYHPNLSASAKPTGMHTALIKSLQESTTQQERTIGFILGDIYSKRITADYKLQHNFSPEEAKTAIKQSQRLLTLL